MSLYGSENGLSKKVTKFYGSVNGVTKEVQELYGGDASNRSVLLYESLPPDVDYIELVLTARGTIKLCNIWAHPIKISINGGSLFPMSSGQVLEDTRSPGDVIRIYESTSGYTFRRWNSNNINALIFGPNCRLTALPRMHHFTEDASGMVAGDYFFAYFNNYGSIVEIPEGSFILNRLASVGNYFFSGYNRQGKISILPKGSFVTKNITTVGSDFFAEFNEGGAISELPKGSFDTRNITSTSASRFMYAFNGYSSATRGNISRVTSASGHTNTIQPTIHTIAAWYSGVTNSYSITQNKNFNWKMSTS